MSQQKSLSLEQFKAALSTEATEKVKKLEADIERLKAELGKKETVIAERKRICRVLFNRCFTMHGGQMCVFCAHREICDKERTVLNFGQDDKN